MVKWGLNQRDLELIRIEHVGAHVLRNLLLERNAKDAVVAPTHLSVTAKTESEGAKSSN